MMNNIILVEQQADVIHYVAWHKITESVEEFWLARPRMSHSPHSLSTLFENNKRE